MTLLSDISFVKRGKNRKKILLCMDKPLMPSEIAKKVYGSTDNSSFNLVSRALAEFKDKKLVELANPKDKTGRLYKLTSTGERVKKEII